MRKQPKCEFLIDSANPRLTRGMCNLRLYGGKVTWGVCNRCIERGENTPEFAAQLAERSERSHPATAARVSGCCDSAKNYISSEI
jgi:hypothetical protein